MNNELLFGIQTNGIKHAHDDPMPDVDTRFRMASEAGVFDYVDKTPDEDEIEVFARASERYGLPVRGSGWFYTLGEHEALLERNLAIAKRLGSRVHNVQVRTFDKDGQSISNEQVVATYLWAHELGERYGVRPCFEVHVNMWSEHFGRVAEVGHAVEAQGVPFCITLDHSHVIFKIDNPAEQEVQGMRAAVLSGDVVLDPFAPGNVIDEWIEAGWVYHCHARAAVPNNPKNSLAHDADGNPGRGIQYPFNKPAPGEYHAEWREEALEPWKEAIRHLLRYHATDANARLGQISTEFIPNLDYGEGCKYSLFEQAIECVKWMREEWASVRQGSTG